MKLTVDASIVVKWFVRESLSNEARLLLAHRLDLHAPDIMPVEFANTIWEKVRKGELPDHRPYMDELPRVSEIVTLHSSHDLLARTAQMAQQLHHSIYDCLYLACAEATESMLITADRAFARKVIEGFSGVDIRDIGADDVADEIGAAATALVIGKDTVEALAAAYDLLAKTDEHITYSLHRDTKGVIIRGDDDWSFYFESPAYRRLERMFSALSRDERIDLLALGWLGDDNRHVDGHQYGYADWQRHVEHACTMIDVPSDHRYEIGLGAHWRTGLDRLLGMSR